MMRKDRKSVDALLENPNVLRALLVDPKGWLKEYGVSEAAISCTAEAHAGLAKAERVAKKANELATLPLLEALPRLHELAETVWDDGVVVERIPFGVVIAERPQLPPPLPPVPPLDDNPEVTTGTGTIRCTFALSCKADVDS
jgi:hypothetical protein